MKLLSFLAVALCVIVVVLTASLDSPGTSAPHVSSPRNIFEPGRLTAEEAFRSLILSPIPAGVRDLQGVGETLQGYRAQLRFQADSAAIDAVIATGFRRDTSPINAAAKLKFATPITFSPAWSLPTGSNVERYRFDGANAATHAAIHYLVVDRASLTVHFVGSGS